MPDYHFELYIAGDAHRSRSAVKILTALCEAHLYGRYQLQVINVLLEPERAEGAKILATPTLLRLVPEPSVRIIGDLTLTSRVLSGLGLLAPRESTGPRGAT